MSILFASNIASPSKKRNRSLSTIFSFAIAPVKPATQVARGVSVGVIHWTLKEAKESIGGGGGGGGC